MAQNEELHFVLMPFMTPGHAIPMLDLARLLAERRILVTFVSTPANLSRIEPTVNRTKKSDLPIRFLSLDFPSKEASLPEGCENVDLLPSLLSLQDFVLATRRLEEPLRRHLRLNAPPPSCLVSDFCLPWTRLLARDLGIPNFVFYSMSCFALLCEYNLNRRKWERGEVAEGWETAAVPGLPLRVEVTRAQAPGFFPRPDFAWMVEEVELAESACHGLIVNTFAELEPQFIDLYEKTLGKKIWPVGPVSLCNKLAVNEAERGGKSTVSAEKIADWLDSMEPRSVVYVSFGSLVDSSLARFKELGMGLEAAGRPFIWVVRAKGNEEEVEEWLAGGFEDRTRDRGLIIRRWAPQLAILSHPSVGGFLTHCGWNSSLEAITKGVPMATWPGFSEQFLNERFLVDGLGVGVPSGVKDPFWMTILSGEDLLKREKVQWLVETLMDGGEEGEERRRRVGRLGGLAKEAMEVGGSSYQSLTQLVEEVKLHSLGNSTQGEISGA